MSFEIRDRAESDSAPSLVAENNPHEHKSRTRPSGWLLALLRIVPAQ
jgi:hypothetical protein